MRTLFLLSIFTSSLAAVDAKSNFKDAQRILNGPGLDAEKISQAERLLIEAIQSTASDDIQWVLAAKDRLASIERLRGKYDTAAAMYTQLLESPELKNPEFALIRYNAKLELAAVEGLRGNFQAAANHLEELIVALKKERPDNDGWRVQFHYELGDIYLHLKKYNQAKEHLNEAIKLIKIPRPFLKEPQYRIELFDQLRAGLLLLNCDSPSDEEGIKAHLLKYDAQRKENLNAAKQAKMAGADTTPFDLIDIEYIFNMAMLNSRTTNFRLAYKQLQEAMNAFSKLKQKKGALAQSDLKEFWMRISAINMLIKLQMLPEAKKEVLQCEALLKESPHPRNQADLDSAKTCILYNEAQRQHAQFAQRPEIFTTLDQAEQYALSSHDAYRRFANKQFDLSTAISLYTLAQIADMKSRLADPTGDLRKKHDELALARCNECLKHLDNLTLDKSDETSLLVNKLRASILARRGETDEAFREATKILTAFRQAHGPDDIGLVDFHLLLQDVEERRGNLDNAWNHAIKQRELSARLMNSYLAKFPPDQVVPWFSYWDEPNLRSAMQFALRHREFRPQAAEMLLNSKAKIAEVIGQLNQLDLRNNLPIQAKQQMRQDVEHKAYLLHGFPDVAPVGLAEALATIENTIQDRIVENNAKPQGKWYLSRDLRAKLKPNELYIDLIALPERDGEEPTYFAWLSTAQRTEVVKLATAAKVDLLITAFTKEMQLCGTPKNKEHPFVVDGFSKREAQFCQSVLQPLSDLLLKPVLNHPFANGKDHWIVCPHGELWSLPWNTLLVSPDEYAIEKINFSYVMSGRDLLQPERTFNKNGAAWVLGGLDYDARPAAGEWRRYPQAEFLQYSKVEQELVAQALKDVWAWNGPIHIKKTICHKQALFDLRESPRLIWLSTHGSSPLYSKRPNGDPLHSCGISFASANYLPKSLQATGGSLPGLLTGAEVLTLPLRDTELVVLSACQTGVGKRQYGQSPSDLRHAFHLAGAKSVIASLWSVPDLETSKLLSKAIKYRATVNNAIALAQAQRELIKELNLDPARSAHPFFWAGFTVTEQ